MTLITDIAAIFIGYLIGSISPAYYLGKKLKKIDIRKIGTGNAGTMNVYYNLGFYPALMTFSFDASKGLVALLLTYYVTGNTAVSYVAGLSAVIGHILPFYLRFKGGQGAATALGILLYFLKILLTTNKLSVTPLLFLLIIVLAILAWKRDLDLLPVTILPLLIIVILFSSSSDLDKFFVCVLSIHLFLVGLSSYIRAHNLLKTYFSRPPVKAGKQ